MEAAPRSAPLRCHSQRSRRGRLLAVSVEPNPRSPFDPSSLTWTCHVCGSVRPDSKIGVCTRRRLIAGGRSVVSANVRHCIDREECRKGAPAVAWAWLSDMRA